MKNSKIAILLCLIMTAFVFSSCREAGNNSSDTNGVADNSKVSAEIESNGMSAPDGE